MYNHDCFCFLFFSSGLALSFSFLKCDFQAYQMQELPVGPLQLAILVVQNRHTETQKSHWDKTNKGNYHLKLCMSFVGLVPVRLLRPSMAILCHKNGQPQRAYTV